MTSKQKFSTFASVLSKSIIRRTALVFLIAIIAVTVVSVAVVYRQSSQNAESLLNNNKLEIEKVLSDVESISKAFSLALPDMVGNDEFISKTTREVVKSDDKILSCAVAYEPFLHNPEDEFYMILSTQREDMSVDTQLIGSQDFDYFYQDWYQIPKLTGKSYWNEPSYSLSGNQRMTVSYSTPLYDIDGIFIGVLRQDLDLEWLSDVSNNLKPYESAVTLVVSKSGAFITHRDKEKILNETIYTDPLDKGSKSMLDKCSKLMAGATGSTSYPADGRMRYVVYTPLENGWSIIGICSYQDFFKAVNQINFILFFIAATGLIGLYFSSSSVIRRLTKSITVLTHSAMNMSRGKFHAQIPTDENSNGEIKQLETSMHYLQRTINEYISLLKASTAKQERIDSELAIANQIQLSFLPRRFNREAEYDCYGAISPAKEVGGDLFHVNREDNYLFFAVGDVSGKGVPAALFMAITKSSFNFFKHRNLPTNEIVSTINNVFSEGNEEGMFVTLFLAKVNLDTMEMEYCNGGHNPLIIVNPDGAARYLKAEPNLAVGLFPDFPYMSEKVQLEKGCRLIAYTDGVSEAENKLKELYGDDRLLDYASHLSPDSSAKQVVENLFESVRKFADGNEQNDDITIFSVNFDN